MDEFTIRACEIIEKRNINSLTVDWAENQIENAKRVYDNLYSYPHQRRKALEDIEVYKIVLRMLKRHEAWKNS